MVTPQLRNAISKARRIKCRVTPLGGRRYLVETPQAHRYTVTAETHEGQRFMRCTCPAGAVHRPCYHLPKAALVDTAIQNMRAH
jgi:hypothetical protein